MKDSFATIAQRLASLRDIMNVSVKELADAIGISEDEYIEHEKGIIDFPLTFLLKAARCLGVDITDLLTGESPKLSIYSVVKKDKGLPIERRVGFEYSNLAFLFKNRNIEPLKVIAKYDAELENQPIQLSYHKGQEFDYILSGKLKVQVNDKIEILEPGDSIYYDSNYGHGMIAVGGSDCEFIAIVTKIEK